LFTIGIRTAVQATGNIKRYQAVVGGLLIFNLPLAYTVLKLGFSPEWVYITSIFIEIVAMCFRVKFLSILTGISGLTYYKEVIGRGMLPTSVILLIIALINLTIGVECESIYDFVVFFIAFVIFYIPLVIIF